MVQVTFKIRKGNIKKIKEKRIKAKVQQPYSLNWPEGRKFSY